MTFERHLPRFAFEVADLGADPGLGDPQLRRAAGGTLLVDDGDEVVAWFEVRTRLDGIDPFPVVFDPRPLLG